MRLALNRTLPCPRVFGGLVGAAHSQPLRHHIQPARGKVFMASNINGLVCLPASYTKTLYFIRHGEAWSNLAAEHDHTQYLSEEWFDASLDPAGWKQAEALNASIKAAGIRPQLIVVSPLTRALQTASAAFGSGPCQACPLPPLMIDTELMPGKQTPHAAISSSGVPPMVALEIAREKLHGNPCDRRRPVSECRAAFPAVDFSLMTEEQDLLWRAEGRESTLEMQERGGRLLQWLMDRPENNIAVVSHSGFLNATLQSFMGRANQSNDVDEELNRWFENCELRTITLCDPSAKGPRKHYADFPGGKAALGVEKVVVDTV